MNLTHVKNLRETENSKTYRRNPSLPGALDGWIANTSKHH